MAVDPGLLGPATLGITQGVSVFMTLLPNISTVRKSDPYNNPEVAADVRVGEIAASAINIGIGVIVTNLTGSPVPVVVSAIVSLILICLYESVLRSESLAHA